MADKINKLVEKDQKLRKNIPEDSVLAEAYWLKINKFDLESTNYIKHVVKKIGLPTIPIVGEKASYNAWLLVQHSQDLKFQKKYLKLLKQNINDINLNNIAYLEDRILMRQGHPQTFGTQLIQDEKSKDVIPYSLKDPENVDTLRKNMGLDTLEKYIVFFKSQ